MTQLRAIAPRVYIDTNPYVNRYPKWTDKVFYQTGSVVSKSFRDVYDSDSESVFYNFYVAQNDVGPGGAQPDSDETNWILLISGNPNLPLFYKDSDVYDFVGKAQNQYTLIFNEIDSDLLVITEEVSSIFGFDSEIKRLQESIRNVEEKNVIDSLLDSEARHNYAIRWDSDSSKFKFVRPVLSVNQTLPDASGNVSYQFTETRTGTREDRLDSDNKGTLFIVVNDSDSDFNGVTYSFTDNGWTRLIGYTEVENEIRYVDVAGDTMTGPLLLSRDPVTDSEAATKAYVDTFNDSDKQDKIIIVNDQTALLAYPKENNRIYYVRSDNTLWMFISGTLQQFVIPGERIFDPVLLEAKAVNKQANYFDVEVQTYRFSSQIGGTLKFFINNTTTPAAFFPQININGTFDASSNYKGAVLLDSQNQTFTIRIPDTFKNSFVYYLNFTSHDGVLTQITIDETTNKVVFSDSNRIFNFGEY